jgi:transcriptional regulator with XRE-family HTH domain
MTQPRNPVRLRAMREALGISQSELARRMGLDQSLVSRAERGLIATWPKFRRQAATALGLPEAALFDGPVESGLTAP